MENDESRDRSGAAIEGDSIVCAPRSPKRRERGSELLEFSLIITPFLMMIFVLVDISWAIFARSSLQWAVRYGAEAGSNTTAAQLAGQCLTPYVKNLVQTSSLGLLNGSSGLDKIKVNYLQPPAYTDTGSPTDVSATTYADAPGNIMEVSVQNYSQGLLLPLVFFPDPGTGLDPDKKPTKVTVYAADMIENTGTIPCVGTAP